MEVDEPSVDPIFHWFLPVRGDSRDPGVVTPADGSDSETRPPTLDYLTMVAQAAEQAGFDSLLTPVGIGCLDPWVVCSAVAARTRRIGFILAFRPTLASPTLIAQQAQGFVEIFGERLKLNVVAGGDPAEQAAYGDHTDHDGRYAATDEALSVIRDLLAGRRANLDGHHLHITDAVLPRPPRRHIPIYFGGASTAATQVAARHSDSYLLWAEPLADIAQRIGKVRKLATANGRRLRFGLRIHVLSRDTDAQAWAEADRIQSSFDPDVISAVQQRMSRMDSVGQSRMAALHAGHRPADARDLTVGPNLWAGIGLVRQGVGTALVGSHQDVADRLVEFHRAGIDEFILSGYPHLEEALRFGEEVAPRVRLKLALAAIR